MKTAAMRGCARNTAFSREDDYPILRPRRESDYRKLPRPPILRPVIRIPPWLPVPFGFRPCPLALLFGFGLVLREQVRHSDLADNLPVDDDRDGLTGTVIDVVAVLTRRRVGTGVHLDLARA